MTLIDFRSGTIYQELARRVGLERMRANVSKLGYGNGDIGATVDTFWLKGPLKISAVEQTRFLARLAQGKLPIREDIQESVREIVHLEQGDNWQLYGKTGWENAPGRDVGWWVGWVQKDDRVYTFALNRLRRHFLRNLLGPPSHQKEQKIGDELLPSAPRPSPLVWSGPNKGSGHRSQMTRRPVAMPCVRPPTAAIASTFGLTPGARASGDYSTRSLTRSMSRSDRHSGGIRRKQTCCDWKSKP
nr:penicillin-binding transpeptidase domain-containing protein [Methylocaldum marinum]